MRFERNLEAGIFASRWLLAPFYLGLIICIVLLLLHFILEMIRFIPKVPGASAAEATLGVLGLIDITFTANLVLIVIFSGYENFVSKFDSAATRDRPDWMTKIDFSGLKQKLMTSIVAISAIQVLKAFMNIEQAADTTKLAWLVGIHLVFVTSMLMLAVSDRLEEGVTTKEHLEGERKGGGRNTKASS